MVRFPVASHERAHARRDLNISAARCRVGALRAPFPRTPHHLPLRPWVVAVATRTPRTDARRSPTRPASADEPTAAHPPPCESFKTQQGQIGPDHRQLAQSILHPKCIVSDDEHKRLRRPIHPTPSKENSPDAGYKYRDFLEPRPPTLNEGGAAIEDHADMFPRSNTSAKHGLKQLKLNAITPALIIPDSYPHACGGEEARRILIPARPPETFGVPALRHVPRGPPCTLSPCPCFADETPRESMGDAILLVFSTRKASHQPQNDRLANPAISPYRRV